MNEEPSNQNFLANLDNLRVSNPFLHYIVAQSDQ